ncbi:MAG: metallophosphoesterase [Prevotella sp.]|nr:metallophosphoesterase [Prevotella sp.]
MKVFVFFLALVVALTAYVSWHLWRMAPAGGALKLTVTGLFLLWMAVFFVGFFVMDHVPIKLAIVLYEVGTTWLIFFLYLLIAFVLADVASLCHLLPKSLLRDNPVGLMSVVGLIAVVMMLGGVEYHHKHRKELTLTTEKAIEKPLTIVLASDLHIGYHNRKAELARWVDLINGENPDLVLIGGDIIDRSLRPVDEGNYAEEFHRIQAPVFTVHGNHEYISQIDEAERFFKEAGIVLLKDSVAHFKGVDVIGRNDRSAFRRATVKALAAGAKGFTILLDHQPYHLEEAEQAGIDFQFSGHTHRGQVWPISWITDAVYEKSWGFHQRGNTRYYVSSGLGIWGPKIRIGTRSEYLVLHLKRR